jgi:hypothetical protein
VIVSSKPLCGLWRERSGPVERFNHSPCSCVVHVDNSREHPDLRSTVQVPRLDEALTANDHDSQALESGPKGPTARNSRVPYRTSPRVAAVANGPGRWDTMPQRSHRKSRSDP